MNFMKDYYLSFEINHLSGHLPEIQARVEVVKMLGLKYTLRTCFVSNNSSSNSCPELTNQVLSFSERRSN